MSDGTSMKNVNSQKSQQQASKFCVYKKILRTNIRFYIEGFMMSLK